MKSSTKMIAALRDALEGIAQLSHEEARRALDAALSDVELRGYLVHDKDNPDGRYFKQKPSISDDDMREHEIWIEPLYATAALGSQLDRLPEGHVILEQADTLDGLVAQTVSVTDTGEEYIRIVHPVEAYGVETDDAPEEDR